MKSIKTILVIAFFFSAVLGAMAQQDTKTKSKAGAELEVYYSHFNKRCATCNAIENETKGLLKKKYGELMEKGTISFTSLNLDEKNDKKVAKKLEISGQALLIIKDGKQVNLTNEGFMNARTNPEKFREILSSNIDKLL